MVVTKHDVTSEYLSQVTGYIPLMWDIFLDTYRFKRERYKRVCPSSVRRIPFWIPTRQISYVCPKLGAGITLPIAILSLRKCEHQAECEHLQNQIRTWLVWNQT